MWHLGGPTAGALYLVSGFAQPHTEQGWAGRQSEKGLRHGEAGSQDQGSVWGCWEPSGDEVGSFWCWQELGRGTFGEFSAQHLWSLNLWFPLYMVQLGPEGRTGSLGQDHPFGLQKGHTFLL